ncbi:MAG: carbohydate-binding domain-containing protein, partial [Gammaproteobacteria bacterium]|nr:carbohydate-binding domain-containing protein [Gammaproteobacteria bacterium]
MRFLLVITSVLIALSGCKPEATPPQQVADDVANNLSFEIELISNSQPDRAVCVELGAEWATCNRFDIILGANDNGVMHTNWSLYIHSVRNLLSESSELFELEHITGDLYRITPTEQFNGFAAGEQHRLEIVGEFFELSKYDYIPG